MIKRQEGFTLIELMITMVVFVLTIAAATGIFVPMLTQFKQQSKIAESNIEGMIGLEILRKDIEQAGFGIPWVVPTAVSYSEAVAPATVYNDSPSGAPRAILSGDGAGLNGSDYLVIKATSVSTSDPAVKWTYITGTGGGGSTVHIWGNTTEDLVSGLDRVIVIIPSRGEANQRILVNDDTSFSDIFNSANFPANFAPATANDRFLVYGLDTVNLRMPFNRADYYISTTTNVPPRCAPNTGVLMKGLINHTTGNRNPEIPLLDCVADMQIIFRSDTDDDGVINEASDDISGLTANQIRHQLKEVRVYILAHEGQRDATYRYPNNSIYVGEDETIPQSLNLGRSFDLTTISNYQNYRWKVYRIVVKPDNLRG